MKNNNGRLLSLDVFRGFDMMFIMGIASIIYFACSLFPEGSECWLARQMSHVPWEGLRHHDTIFPVFLFIAGVSFPFSYAKQLSKGAGRGQIYWKIIRRGLLLFVLGLVYNDLLWFNFAELRIFSVLARIGFAWMFAALLYINFKPGVRAGISVALLLGYWLMLCFFQAPDYPDADPFSMEGNLVGYIDRQLFGNHVLYKGVFDPEGLLSLLPAIVTALLGMFTGEFVRLPETRVSGGRKTIYMIACAAVLAAVGLVWSRWFPINKALWSSTFVLVVGAFAMASFALFYYIIDVRGWTRWTKFFEIIGLNSITVYMFQRIVPVRGISEFLFGGTASLLGKLNPGMYELIITVGYFAVSWLFLYFLYRRKIFLKV